MMIASKHMLRNTVHERLLAAMPMLLMIDQSFLDWSFIDGMKAFQEH
jgi:hypothetical protein